MRWFRRARRPFRDYGGQRVLDDAPRPQTTDRVPAPPPRSRAELTADRFELVGWAQFDGDGWHDFVYAGQLDRRAFEAGRLDVPMLFAGGTYLPLYAERPDR